MGAATRQRHLLRLGERSFNPRYRRPFVYKARCVIVCESELQDQANTRSKAKASPMRIIDQLQKSKFAGLRIFAKCLKREAIADSYSLNRATNSMLEVMPACGGHTQGEARHQSRSARIDDSVLKHDPTHRLVYDEKQEGTVDDERRRSASDVEDLQSRARSLGTAFGNLN
jgi:hypothetical protein